MWRNKLICLAVIVGTLIGCVSSEVVRQDEGKAYKLIDQGVAFLRMGMFDDAEASFKVAYEMSGIPEALDGLGSVEFARKKYDRAEEFFLQAMKRDPEYTTVYRNLALLYHVTNRPQKALEMYRRAILANPDDPVVRNNYGVFLAEEVEKNRLPFDAIEEIRKALALQNDSRINFNLKKLEVNHD